MSNQLSRSEKKALREQIKEAKAKLNEDKKNRYGGCYGKGLFGEGT